MKFLKIAVRSLLLGGPALLFEKSNRRKIPASDEFTRTERRIEMALRKKPRISSGKKFFHWLKH